MKLKILLLCCIFFNLLEVYSSSVTLFPDRLFNRFMNRLVNKNQPLCRGKVTDTHVRSAILLLDSYWDPAPFIKGVSPECQYKWRQILLKKSSVEQERMRKDLDKEESRRRIRRYALK